MAIKTEKGRGKFHRKGRDFRKGEGGDGSRDTKNGGRRKLREKRGGKGEEKGKKTTKRLRRLGKMFFGVVTSHTSEVISAAVEFTRRVRPDNRRKRESEDVLGFF